ncbi:MAG: cupin domain-containing protein, partial [Candidatus Andersenbacteria bacterium]|nr:cupin domain-containing protein [Candidatus Andersenbacteria bacterium]
GAKPELVADDERGIIEKLAEGNYQSVFRITSKKGSVRANHYHKADSHLCYLSKGRVKYVFRPAEDENAPLEEKIIEAGQLFYTPPMEAHAMVFMEDSEFYTFNTEPRHGQNAYEDEIVRVKLVE